MKTKPVILVVDDNLQDRELLEAYLAPQGYEILKAEDGEAALKSIVENPVDLVLLDVKMPKVDGFEVCRRIKGNERRRNIQVVMITALSAKEDRIKGIEAGAGDFITKPIDKGEVLARIKMLLKMKDLHDSLDSSKKELQFTNEKLTTVNDELHVRNAEMGEVNDKLIKLNELLMHQAITDKLTGASNRHKFDEAFTAELVRSKRFRTPLSLIMFDIDRFKTINDTFGHPVGDDVLCELSALVRKYVRVHDTFARWGGDEFMIMMVNSDTDHAYLLAEKLRREIEKHSFRPVDSLTCSFGVAQLMYDETAERLCLRADEAMYAAKLCGRNNVSVAGAIGRRDKDSCAPGAQV